jgi:hypothetical protein
MRTDGKVVCEGCGEWYFPALARKHAGCVVVHSGTGSSQGDIGSSQPSELVVHKGPVGSSHGRYKDEVARRKYRREWMARKRAGLKGDGHGDH